MVRRPLCIVCLLLMFSMCIVDRMGFPLIRGNPIPDNVADWIEKNPDVTICGEVTQTTENEFSQSIYLSNTYLIYQSQKISIENVKAYLKKKEEVPLGTVVLLSGKLQRVEEKRNPGEFDSRQFYACQHIYYFLKKGEILDKTENYSAYRQALCTLKTYFSKNLEKIAGKQAGIFQAIVLGDKSNLEDTVKLRYQMSGIVHILAISGLHISVIGTGLYNLLMKTGMGIWPSGMIALIIMLQYGIMTGGSVSTMRAVSMFLIAAGAKITGRTYDLPTALAVSAMMILGESGAYLYSSGFLLSFSAVVGAGIVVPLLERYSKKDKKIVRMLVASVGVQMTMLPVSLYFFGEVSVIGIFLNLLVLPTVGIILGSGVFATLAGCVSLEIARVFIIPGRLLAVVYEKMCEFAGNIPFATWIAGQPEIWQIIGYYMLLGSACILYVRREKLSRMKGGIFSVLLCALGIFILTGRKRTEFLVTCLDVGQGDCIVLETPERNCFIVDGGSTSKGKTGQYQILPYLKNRGISRVDGILISHTDQDHISGIQEILELTAENLNPVQIGCLYLPKWKNPPEAWEKLKNTAKEAGIAVYEVGEGNCLKAGKLRLDIVAPPSNASGEDVNEDCMVLQIQYGNFTGLLTGDMGAETEKKLLEKNVLRDVDFLKVGHHGSHYSTSEEFLKKIQPEYAVISCSSTNTYGHPSPEIVERLECAGCETGFTMKNGAVTVHTDGQKVGMEYFISAQ